VSDVNPGSEPAPKPSGSESDSDSLKGDASAPATDEQADTVSGGSPEPTEGES
jgi:hypothetical protein